MTRLYISTLENGDQLIRMPRPRDWDHLRWCALEGCDQQRECSSVYGYEQVGASTMIGWRAACSRKHALAVWAQELAPA